MASPEVPREPPLLATLADELLEEIFLRVPAAADLARASASQPPAPTSSAASVPSTHHPSSAYTRTRLASSRRSRPTRLPRLHAPSPTPAPPTSRAPSSPIATAGIGVTSETAAPVHRRCLVLPAIPDDLAALAHHPGTVEFEPFLAPANEDEGGTSFRVICLVNCQSELVTFIYSSGSGQWHAATFDGWTSLVTGNTNHSRSMISELSGRDYAHGCFIWELPYMDKLLVLDTHSMEFSYVNFPQPHYFTLTDQSDIINRAVVEVGEGRLWMLTLCCHLEYGMYLWYTILESNGQGANKWHSKEAIPLPFDYCCYIIGVAGGSLLL